MNQNDIKAKKAGFFKDLFSVAKRALRAMTREPEFLFPSLIIPVFFFGVNVGALSKVAGSAGVTDFEAFQLPVAIIFAVTGVSRAAALVTDITNGFFDRMLVSPVNRLSLLLGLMIADFVAVILLSLPVIILGTILGVRFETGILGIGAFILISALWGLVFTGFPYAIALKTGNPAAVNSSFLLFFPFTFLTTASVPLEALNGWLASVAKVNPVTYLLEGLRSLILEGWVVEDLARALIAIAIIGSISFTLAFTALNGRVNKR